MLPKSELLNNDLLCVIRIRSCTVCDMHTSVSVYVRACRVVYRVIFVLSLTKSTKKMHFS